MLATCTCCGGFGYFVAEMMNPDFEPYQSPDGRFAAKFPGEVRTGTRATGRDGETAKSVEASRAMLGQAFETYFVYSVDLTARDGQKKPSQVVDELADGLRLTLEWFAGLEK